MVPILHKLQVVEWNNAELMLGHWIALPLNVNSYNLKPVATAQGLQLKMADATVFVLLRIKSIKHYFKY